MIVAAAIKYGECIVFLPQPARHHDIICAWHDSTGMATSGHNIRGFITSDHLFVDRVDAALIAWGCDQITEEKSALYSEDLW